MAEPTIAETLKLLGIGQPEPPPPPVRRRVAPPEPPPPPPDLTDESLRENDAYYEGRMSALSEEIGTIDTEIGGIADQAERQRREQDRGDLDLRLAVTKVQHGLSGDAIRGDEEPSEYTIEAQQSLDDLGQQEAFLLDLGPISEEPLPTAPAPAVKPAPGPKPEKEKGPSSFYGVALPYFQQWTDEPIESDPMEGFALEPFEGPRAQIRDESGWADDPEHYADPETGLSRGAASTALNHFTGAMEYVAFGMAARYARIAPASFWARARGVLKGLGAGAGVAEFAGAVSGPLETRWGLEETIFKPKKQAEPGIRYSETKEKLSNADEEQQQNIMYELRNELRSLYMQYKDDASEYKEGYLGRLRADTPPSIPSQRLIWEKTGQVEKTEAELEPLYNKLYKSERALNSVYRAYVDSNRALNEMYDKGNINLERLVLSKEEWDRQFVDKLKTLDVGYGQYGKQAAANALASIERPEPKFMNAIVAGFREYGEEVAERGYRGPRFLEGYQGPDFVSKLREDLEPATDSEITGIAFQMRYRIDVQSAFQARLTEERMRDDSVDERFGIKDSYLSRLSTYVLYQGVADLYRLKLVHDALEKISAEREAEPEGAEAPVAPPMFHDVGKFFGEWP